MMKMDRTAAVAFLGLALLGAGLPAATAQMADPAAKTAPGATVDPAKSFDAGLSIFEKEMMGAARAMPPASYSFAPSAAIFVPTEQTDYKGVRTFAQQVTHVAQANYIYASMVGGMKPDIDPRSLVSLTDKDQILAALTASFVFSHKAFATLTAQNAFASVRDDQTRASLAAGLVAHGFDHYGQMVEYLRMNGIVPPASVK